MSDERHWMGLWWRPPIAVPLVLHARGGLAVMLLCVVGAPALLSDYQLTLFSTGIAYSVAVLGVALGFAGLGMLALTQPAMMIVGGFVALELIDLWHVSFLLAALVAVLAGMIVAVPLGWLTCRLDKFSFAILGFAFTYLVAMLASSSVLVDITGGELGKPFPALTLFGVQLHHLSAFALLSAISLAAFSLAAILFRSTMGRFLLVMKQDETVARAMGVNTNLHRISLTAIVSGFGALGGALIGQSSGYLAPPQFDVALSISLLACALVGGTAYLLGAFIGTMILYVAPALLGLAQVDSELLVGAILLVFLVAMPTGLLGFVGQPLPGSPRARLRLMRQPSPSRHQPNESDRPDNRMALRGGS
jgi:branched-chain amino acid transport system permease protein